MQVITISIRQQVLEGTVTSGDTGQIVMQVMPAYTRIQNYVTNCLIFLPILPRVNSEL
jgi:hypothetical protein